MSVLRRLKFDAGNLAEVGYDVNTGMMEVVFRDVPEYLYTYEGVPPVVFCSLINADSVGSAFAKSFRAHPKEYPFTKSLTRNRPPAPVDTSIKK